MFRLPTRLVALTRQLPRHVTSSTALYSQTAAEPSPVVKAEKSLMQALRKSTGYSFLACRDALVKFNNDAKKAESWMHEQAREKGWETATKVGGRRAREGVIASYAAGRRAVIVEVNCETDFVARSDGMKELAGVVAKELINHNTVGEIDMLPLMEKGTPIGEKIALLTTSLRERLHISRATVLECGDDDVFVSYAHPRGSSTDDVLLGAFGVIVQISAEQKALGNALCQHIVGMAPTQLGDLTAAAPKETAHKETKAASPEEQEELNEQENDVTSELNMDTDTLLDQPFMLQSDLTVREYLENNHAKCTKFIRFECGAQL